jgi:hypothetical protein
LGKDLLKSKGFLERQVGGKTPTFFNLTSIYKVIKLREQRRE